MPGCCTCRLAVTTTDQTTSSTARDDDDGGPAHLGTPRTGVTAEVIGRPRSTARRRRGPRCTCRLGHRALPGAQRQHRRVVVVDHARRGRLGLRGRRRPGRSRAALRRAPRPCAGSNWRALAPLELVDGLLDRAGSAVGAGRRHRVEGVGDRDDPGELRDLGAGAGPSGSRGRRGARGGAGSPRTPRRGTRCPAPSQAAHGVQLDRGELVVGEPAGLLQDLGGHAELADVVQHRRRSAAR